MSSRAVQAALHQRATPTQRRRARPRAARWPLYAPVTSKCTCILQAVPITRAHPRIRPWSPSPTHAPFPPAGSQTLPASPPPARGASGQSAAPLPAAAMPKTAAKRAGAAAAAAFGGGKLKFNHNTLEDLFQTNK